MILIGVFGTTMLSMMMATMTVIETVMMIMMTMRAKTSSQDFDMTMRDAAITIRTNPEIPSKPGGTIGFINFMMNNQGEVHPMATKKRIEETNTTPNEEYKARNDTPNEEYKAVIQRQWSQNNHEANRRSQEKYEAGTRQDHEEAQEKG